MNKREIKREFKERKVAKGVCAMRCIATGEVWVSASANLEASHNGLLFMLRNGLHRTKPLQAAWDQRGADAFQWEVVETFEEELAPMLLRDTMRDRQKFWERELNATVMM